MSCFIKDNLGISKEEKNVFDIVSKHQIDGDNNDFGVNRNVNVKNIISADIFGASFYQSSVFQNALLDLESSDLEIYVRQPVSEFFKTSPTMHHLNKKQRFRRLNTFIEKLAFDIFIVGTDEDVESELGHDRKELRLCFTEADALVDHISSPIGPNLTVPYSDVGFQEVPDSSIAENQVMAMIWLACRHMACSFRIQREAMRIG